MTTLFAKLGILFVSLCMLLTSTMGVCAVMGMGSAFMSDCPAMHHMNSMCSQDILEHIEQWQNLLLAVLESELIAFFAAAMIAGSVTVLTARLLSAGTASTALRPPGSRWRLFSAPPHLQSIMEALADGILQPKLFAHSVIA